MSPPKKSPWGSLTQAPMKKQTNWISYDLWAFPPSSISKIYNLPPSSPVPYQPASFGPSKYQKIPTGIQRIQSTVQLNLWQKTTSSINQHEETVKVSKHAIYPLRGTNIQSSNISTFELFEKFILCVFNSLFLEFFESTVNGMWFNLFLKFELPVIKSQPITSLVVKSQPIPSYQFTSSQFSQETMELFGRIRFKYQPFILHFAASPLIWPNSLHLWRMSWKNKNG